MVGSKLKWKNILQFLYLVFSYRKALYIQRSGGNDLQGYKNFGVPKLTSFLVFNGLCQLDSNCPKRLSPIREH